MPQWDPEEVRQGDALAAEIAGCRLPRRRAALESAVELRLSEAVDLVDGLAGNSRALLVRQLLRVLGFDEHRHIRWRLEHKLIQALVLRYWVPELIPVTWGFGALVVRHGAHGLKERLSSDFPEGYVLKSALGDSSGESRNHDHQDSLLDALLASEPGQPRAILEERHILQERIPIAIEYRVHTLEDDVIEDLTFRRYDGGSIPGERDAPNAFVVSVLRRLPDSIVGGSLLAWDVVLQPSGEFSIIEVNFSGYHPAFKRGFHCSGYFHDQHWGDCDTARLLNHVARVDGVEITAVADVHGRPSERRFYQQTADWQRRHLGLPIVRPPKVARRSTEEDVQLRIGQIEAFTGPRHHNPLGSVLELRLSEAIPLLGQLAASTRALMMRQALLAFGFDERRLTGWRLEHKLVQAIVLRHYCPESLPLTRGLDELAQEVEFSDLRGHLHEVFPEGFVIKTALGDCSGQECDQRTEGILRWIERGGRTFLEDWAPIDEEFIVQARKRIRREYRVHSIEDRVIEDLTVHRHEGAVRPGEREGPNAYVCQILVALPPGITSGAHLGWDVALLEEGGFAIIEVNVGGLHTIYNPGFHCSGFFHHREYGAIYSARLLRFLERAYQCQIKVIPDAPAYHDEHYFYSEVKDWKTRF